MDFFPFDDVYLQRLRDGDRWTEEHFVAYFTQLLRLKLRGRLRPEDSDDVLQEVFLRTLKAIRNTDGIREPRKLGTLVIAITNNLVLERYRRTKAEHTQLDDSIPAPEARISVLDAEPDYLMPRFVVTWDPSRISADEYAELITLLGDLARASGGMGVQRIVSEVLGLDQALGR